MKISKILCLALVILAVVTFSASVNAYTMADLVNTVTSRQTINGVNFELSSIQKTAVKNYIETYVTDAQADAAYSKINQAMNLFDQTDYTSIDKLSASQKAELISLGKQAATDVGLTLTVDTANNTFTLTKANGSVVTSGSIPTLVVTGSSSTVTTTTTSSGSTLLYTGASYAVYAVTAIAIVAVALVVKKITK